MAAITFESSEPGRWERDLTHLPRPVTPVLAALFPATFADGDIAVDADADAGRATVTVA